MHGVAATSAVARQLHAQYWLTRVVVRALSLSFPLCVCACARACRVTVVRQLSGAVAACTKLRVQIDCRTMLEEIYHTHSQAARAAA
jgi:hypothetical protein